MEPINVTSITSNLTAHCTIQDNNNDLIQVGPGEVVNADINLNLDIVPDCNAINSSVYHAFNIEGDARTKAFAVVAGTGLVSALGTEPGDFAPADPAQIKISLPEAMAGQNVRLTLMEDFEESERIVWVLGDIDEVI